MSSIEKVAHEAVFTSSVTTLQSLVTTEMNPCCGHCGANPYEMAALRSP
jgi:hypothetical protein